MKRHRPLTRLLLLVLLVHAGSGDDQESTPNNDIAAEEAQNSPGGDSAPPVAKTPTSSSPASSSGAADEAASLKLAELAERLAKMEEMQREQLARAEAGGQGAGGGGSALARQGGGVAVADADAQKNEVLMANLDEGGQSLLEVFGDASKRWLLKHLAPTTDPACTWSWRFGRCEPRCLCQFAPKLGDYWPSRACRLVTSSDDARRSGRRNKRRQRWGSGGGEEDSGDDAAAMAVPCDPNAPELGFVDKVKAVAGSAVAAVRKVPRGVARLSAVTLGGAARGVIGAARAVERHAPSTDRECRFNWEANGLGDDDDDDENGGGGGQRGGGFHLCEPAHKCTFRYTFGDFHPGRSCRLRPSPPASATDEAPEAGEAGEDMPAPATGSSSGSGGGEGGGGAAAVDSSEE